MSKLEAIKEQARVNAVLGKTASQDDAKDTLKLIAALEAVETVRDTMRREEGDWANPEAHFARLIEEAITGALA